MFTSPVLPACVICSIAGGLAWLGFLAVGSLGEQVKTRMEVAAEEQGVREVREKGGWAWGGRGQGTPCVHLWGDISG